MAVQSRCRQYEAILYPEDMQLTYIDSLNKNVDKWYLSPLHNLDRYSEAEYKSAGKEGTIATFKPGDKKKPHYHLIIEYSGVKSREQVSDFLNTEISLSGHVMFQKVRSMAGSLRYLCHIDNDDKAKYNVEDVTSNVSDYATRCMELSDAGKVLREIIKLCKENEVKEFFDLVSLCSGLGNEFLSSVVNNAYFFTQLCRSMRNISVSSTSSKVSSKKLSSEALEVVDKVPF